jgi:hypothetical protein
MVKLFFRQRLVVIQSFRFPFDFDSLRCCAIYQGICKFKNIETRDKEETFEMHLLLIKMVDDNGEIKSEKSISL